MLNERGRDIMASKIKQINFSLMSPEIVRKLSVMEVTTSEVYDIDGYPIEGGVMDPRMGVIDPGMRCKTCGETMGGCPGHFGRIELAKPVLNVNYLKQIKDALTFTCPKCGKLLLEGKDAENIEAKASKLTPPSKCPSCGESIEKIKFEKPFAFFRGKKQLTPEEIREQLEKISDEDAKKLGFVGGRPEWTVLTTILVPSITVRPSITLENGDRSEDDLTHKLVDIVRINKRLKDNLIMGAPEFIIDDLWELLQYHVATFFNNELSGVPPARHRSGRALKTIAQRLKSKEGRFRHNLSGKRVNYSARTVISPDPNISINEVGVPEEVAKELTVPIKVTKENMEFLKELIKNGPDKHPGANYVVRPDGLRKRIMEFNKEMILEELAPGYIVERHLMDGDVVLFNRQPSLHRMSIMAHRVKVMPNKTFRLNLCVCPPYNADFDGDEMNLHVPQTAEARAEAEQLMLVEENIRSPRFGGPIIGANQDYISGAYLLTKDGVKIPKDKVAQMLVNIGMYDVKLDKEEYTGKEVFSMVIPDNITITFRDNMGNPVVIENGQLKEGVIDEKAIASFKGKLLDEIDKKNGHHEAALFLDRVTRLILEFLMMRGFTVSLDDLDLGEDAIKMIDEIIEEQLNNIDKIIKDYKEGKMKPNPGRTLDETLEDNIMAELWTITNKVQEVIKANAKEKGALVMAKTGARGNIQNLAYMSGLVGQEMLRGKRIFRGYKDRVLAHFKKGSLGAEAHGFVRSPFKKGLNPIEFFFEAMKGREGIMDSSLKTKVSGYLERRLVNALQDLKVGPDGTVRDDAGHIIQFVPGEDGIDPAKSDYGKLRA